MASPSACSWPLKWICDETLKIALKGPRALAVDGAAIAYETLAGRPGFWQKQIPAHAPPWVRTWHYEGRHEKPKDYVVCDALPTLAWLANLAAIPLHVWASRAPTLDRPDWCVLDLDPKGAPFEHVVRVAKAARALCEEIELPAFVKTSGSSGLHVLLPLGRQCTYEESRSLGELLARVLVSGLPEIATITRAVSRRIVRVSSASSIRE